MVCFLQKSNWTTWLVANTHVKHFLHLHYCSLKMMLADSECQMNQQLIEFNKKSKELTNKKSDSSSTTIHDSKMWNHYTMQCFFLEKKVCPVQPIHIRVDEKSSTLPESGPPNAQVCLDSSPDIKANIRPTCIQNNVWFVIATATHLKRPIAPLWFEI